MIVGIDPAASKTRAALRVRFCDTDLMGIVHHANYLAYFEIGRVEWLRRRGITYAEWTARGIHLPVVDAAVRYRAPARFDDALVVDVQLVELRAASLRFEYRLERGRELLAEGSTRLACIGAGYRPQRFPSDVLKILSSAETAPSESREIP
jgi:acyl-CoA thioester hydrolase